MGVKFGAFPSEPFAESKLTHTSVQSSLSHSHSD
jgi:hypothetical protein